MFSSPRLSPWRQIWYLALIHLRADKKKNASQTILISTATPSSHVYILRPSLQAKGMLSLFHSFIVQTSANLLYYCSLVINAHTAEMVWNLYNGGFASTNNFNNKFEQLFVLKCIRFKLLSRLVLTAETHAVYRFKLEPFGPQLSSKMTSSLPITILIEVRPYIVLCSTF